MAPYMSVERVHHSDCPGDSEAVFDRLVQSERGPLSTGLVKSEQWRQLPTEGLYQLVMSELLDDGCTHPLEPGGGRAVAVACVLDLGLRMLESDRGRDPLENLARKAICVWRERPVPGPVMEPWNVDVPAAVDEFLRCVRHHFPSVKIDDRNGFCHEEGNNTMPYLWVDEHSTLGQFDFTFKTAAVLHLNWQLIDKLYWARLKADSALRQRREDERLAETARFNRLQFHLGAMVTHHLCHLFVNFLRGFEDLAYEVTDMDLMRLVRRYDPGAEFEVEFFGGRPKLFIDQHGPKEESYPGQSYVIKRGRNGSRMAAVVAQYKIESYLKGDFSVPLLTEVEAEVFPMERYQDVLRRFGGSKHESCQWRESQAGTRRVAEPGSFDQQTLSVPWDIQGVEYQLLKRACFDPAIRLVDVTGL
ncbi:hypothetical protein N657DRAFT_676684 [Parathielavia appendiculata]|uniref:Uncharacterized protein n=1 Tax=Parathielavia appendiculata TaxID=2587402 RepID=A0AAN6UAM1_9PEZI|nr:hypothetical protein N657DRAFT_676684 [Parathielavia appendiculata]